MAEEIEVNEITTEDAADRLLQQADDPGAVWEIAEALLIWALKENGFTPERIKKYKLKMDTGDVVINTYPEDDDDME